MRFRAQTPNPNPNPYLRNLPLALSVTYLELSARARDFFEVGGQEGRRREGIKWRTQARRTYHDVNRTTRRSQVQRVSQLTTSWRPETQALYHRPNSSSASGGGQGGGVHFDFGGQGQGGGFQSSNRSSAAGGASRQDFGAYERGLRRATVRRRRADAREIDSARSDSPTRRGKLQDLRRTRVVRRALPPVSAELRRSGGSRGLGCSSSARLRRVRTGELDMVLPARAMNAAHPKRAKSDPAGMRRARSCACRARASWEAGPSGRLYGPYVRTSTPRSGGSRKPGGRCRVPSRRQLRRRDKGAHLPPPPPNLGKV